MYVRGSFSKCVFTAGGSEIKIGPDQNGARGKWRDLKRAHDIRCIRMGWRRQRGTHVYWGLMREWPMKGFAIIEICTSRYITFRAVTGF